MLQLYTLGAPTLRRADEAPVTLQRRPLALLAMVAAAGASGVSREKVIAVLWPDADEEKGRHALAQSIYALRRACGADVVTGSATLRLDPDVITADVAELAKSLKDNDAARVAELYQGAFLDGFRLPNADEFDRWLERERERLRGAVARGFERAASSASGRGELREAANWWKRVAALDPLDSRVALALAEALAAAGDTSAAVKQAEVHQALRRAELDLPPDPSLVALVARLRSAKNTPRAAVPASAQQPPSAAPVVAQPSQSGSSSSELHQAAAAVSPVRRDDPGADARPRRRRLQLWGAVALVVVAGSLVAARGAWLARTGGALDQRRVMVSVLANRTGDPTLAPLGDMAADWVGTELARTGLVNVVDSRSVIGAPSSTDRNTDDPGAKAREAARAAGAGVVVWGSYYKRGDSLELHAELTDVRDGALIRQVPLIVAPANNPMSAVQQLAEHVMGALATVQDPRLGDWAHRRGTPPSYDSYREFVEGLEANGRQDFAGALPYYRRSVQLDSTFIDPLFFAASAEEQLGDPAAADSLLSRVALARDRLTPFDAHLLDFLVALLHGDPDRAYVVARAAAQQLGTSETFLMAAQASDHVDRPREAVDWFTRMDMNSGWMSSWALECREPVEAAHIAGRADAALGFAQMGRRNAPDAIAPRFCMAEAEIGLGDIPAALAEVDSAAAVPVASGWKFDELLYRIGNEMATHHHPDQARALWRRLVSWDATHADSGWWDSGTRDREVRALLYLGRSTDALRRAREFVAAFPTDPVALGTLGMAEAATGDTVSARATADGLSHRLAGSTHAWERGPLARAQARIESSLGHRVQAAALLREALQDVSITEFDLHRSPAYFPLRGTPAFADLVIPRG